MSAERQRGLSRRSFICMILLIALMVPLVILGVLERIGYTLLYPGVTVLGAGLWLWLLAGWGALTVHSRVTGDLRRRIVGVLLIVLMLFLLLGGASLLGRYTSTVLPTHYNTIVTEGRTVIIMRQPDLGLEDEQAAAETVARMDARQAALDAASPERVREEGVYDAAAYGWCYRVYPGVLGILCDKKHAGEGTIYRGIESGASLLYEWTDPATLHLYLENAEVGDSGELLLHY